MCPARVWSWPAPACNAGRILHHLKQNLWKPETHVMIVGYQGHGSWDASWWRARRWFASTARRWRWRRGFTPGRLQRPRRPDRTCCTGSASWRPASPGWS
ncbi:MAG: hypothetical protein IPM17_15540 [Verrucomicrobia bacterium]|nr:hypothetical protein [Verrucomicrobiota bacterium]